MPHMEFRHERRSVLVLNVTTDPSSLLLADAGTGCFHSAAPPSVSQSEAEQKLLWERNIKRKTKHSTSTKLLIDNKHKVSSPQWFTSEGCEAESCWRTAIMHVNASSTNQI